MKTRTGSLPEDFVEVDSLLETQELLYLLIYEFHDLCERHALTYNAFGGTLLGAVRHQGIIPWDDDIDVSMPKPDYDKLKEIVKAYDKFTIFDFPQKNYAYPFMKFCFSDTLLIESTREKFCKLKLYIDVFPIEGYPKENEDAFFKKYKSYKMGAAVCTMPIEPSPVLVKKLAYPFKLLKGLRYRMFGYRYYLGKQVALQHMFRYEDAEYVLCQGAGWNQKGKLLKQTYLSRKLYPFGRRYIWGIEDYDEHLTRLYGDYMTPPPVEKQNPQHSYHLYVKKYLLEEITHE